MPKKYGKERFVPEQKLFQTLLFCVFEGQIRSLVHSRVCYFRHDRSLHVIWNGFFL